MLQKLTGIKDCHAHAGTISVQRQHERSIMTKGLAWITLGKRDTGKVVVASDNGHQELMPAARYAIANIDPPIYELPRHDRKQGRDA